MGFHGYLALGLIAGLGCAATGAAAQDAVTGACGQPLALNAERLVFETSPTEVVGAFANIQRREPRYIELDIQAPMALTLTTLATVDATLVLFDDAGEIVAFDDDSGDDLNARLVAMLEPGSYCAQVGIYGGLSEPNAVVPVAISKAPSGDACILQADAPVSLQQGGQEIVGAGVLDGAVRQAVTLAPGTGMSIAARSPMFDTMLTLQDAYGREVATDDDGGEDTNSLLDVSPVTEETTYCIALTALDSERGVYTLTVTPTPVAGTAQMPWTTEEQQQFEAQEGAAEAVEDAASAAAAAADAAAAAAGDAAQDTTEAAPAQ